MIFIIDRRILRNLEIYESRVGPRQKILLVVQRDSILETMASVRDQSSVFWLNFDFSQLQPFTTIQPEILRDIGPFFMKFVVLIVKRSAVPGLGGSLILALVLDKSVYSVSDGLIRSMNLRLTHIIETVGLET